MPKSYKPEVKSQKLKVKKYAFHVHTKRHQDIYEFLESLDKPMRGDFIRTAIRAFIYKSNSSVVQPPLVNRPDEDSLSLSSVFG